MTSLGGQFSAKRLGDSPFTIRAEVLGGLESRGVLRKISDMLEVIMKRIDSLSKRDNVSDTRILDELSSAIDSFLGVPPGRGSCPLTGPLPFDLIYTDYHGLQQMKQHMGLSLKKHKEAAPCRPSDSGKESFLQILHRSMEIHGTVYYETQRPPEVPAFVKNHGLLPQNELQQLLRRAKVSSQHPYAEQYIGRPHVLTVDYNNSEEFESAIREVMTTKRFGSPANHTESRCAPSFTPGTQDQPSLHSQRTGVSLVWGGALPAQCEGMLERVHAYIQHQDFCIPGVSIGNDSKVWPGNSSSHFVHLPDSSGLAWAGSVASPSTWPPLSAMRLLLSEEGQSCIEQCQDHNLVCEPTFFHFINNKEAFTQLQIQCDALESEMNHIYPAFSVSRRDCCLQKEPLLFSCAGFHSKFQRLCPCRDFRKGQRESYTQGGVQGFQRESYTQGGVQGFQRESYTQGGVQGFQRESYTQGGVQGFQRESYTQGGVQGFQRESYTQGGVQGFQRESYTQGGVQGFQRESYTQGGVQGFQRESYTQGGVQGFQRESYSITVLSMYSFLVSLSM
ncbi:UNVERIFIED_CONTAM: hypothetical protein FKN15_067952 [Acipenser sinensis]